MAAVINPHPCHTRSIWNDPAKVQQLCDLWGKMTTAQIAREIGCTASAAIGKAHRLGLPHLGNPVGAPAQQFQPKPTEREPYLRHADPIRKSNGRIGENNPGGIAIRRMSRAADADRPLRTKRHGSAEFLFTGGRKARAEQAPLPLFDQGREPVPYHTLGARQCRWIVGPYALHRADIAPACGCETEEGSSWCAGHRAMAVSVKPVADEDELGRLARAADLSVRAA